jgi:hypothetical protein
MKRREEKEAVGKEGKRSMLRKKEEERNCKEGSGVRGSCCFRSRSHGGRRSFP